MGKNALRRLLEHYDRFSDYVEPKIDRDIEENRKGRFRLCFSDENGNSVNGVKLKIKQVRHDFRFGATTFFIDQMDTAEQNAIFEERFRRIFNYAVIPLYWDTLEPEKGNPRFSKDSKFIARRPTIDGAVEFCERNGLDMKGHCLVYNSFQPDWISDDNRTLKIEIDQRLRALSEHIGNKLVDADVINEMLTIYKNCYKGNGARNLQITDERDHEKWCFDICKKYFPHTRLFWNEGMQESMGQHYRGYRSYYHMALREWLNRGAPIEGIGMQFHAFWPYWKGTDAFDELDRVLNPLRMIDVFDCYGEFGLPIHMSEISIPSWTGEGEDEDAQAELVRRLYRLWFSRKHCRSIVWWNMADDTAYSGENIYHGGIIRRDCSEKPAYRVLDELINKEWHTELEACADGEYSFNGFYGMYEIEAEANGKQIKKTVRLTPDTTGFDNRLGNFRKTNITI